MYLTRNQAYRKVPWVRIPPSPPVNIRVHCYSFRSELFFFVAHVAISTVICTVQPPAHALKSAGSQHNLLAETGMEILRQACKGLPRQAGRIVCTAMRLAAPPCLRSVLRA